MNHPEFFLNTPTEVEFDGNTVVSGDVVVFMPDASTCTGAAEAQSTASTVGPGNMMTVVFADHAGTFVLCLATRPAGQAGTPRSRLT